MRITWIIATDVDVKVASLLHSESNLSASFSAIFDCRNPQSEVKYIDSIPGVMRTFVHTTETILGSLMMTLRLPCVNLAVLKLKA